MTTDANGGGAHGTGGRDLRTVVRDSYEGALDFGYYLPAIERWEGITRPAPVPGEANSNGSIRLRAEFSEWMMGWPGGWVTDFIEPSRRKVKGKISRSAAMKAIGNGVCTQQAVKALIDLLSA